MTLVVKLGSSIVAADDGELRADVLDSICAQVAALKRGGEQVVMVTSGAIARGMRVMGLRAARPTRMDELQAASAVGQGDLFRAYESRLAGERAPRRAGAAHPLRRLRTRPLPERAPDADPAARLGRRPGDQRERHDLDRRDHLRRQRLPRGPGRGAAAGAAAGPADQHRRRLHGRPAHRPGGRAGRARSHDTRDFDRSRSARPRASAAAACAARSPRRGSPASPASRS